MALANARASRVRLYLFGHFRAEKNSHPVPVATRKVQALLAYLVLHPEAHAREKLSALFWGDSPDRQARLSLRTALKFLRQQFGQDLVLADREFVQLDPAFPVWVDAKEFQQMANSRGQAANDASSVGRLLSAINLYQGDLLSDFYDDWILAERQ